MIIVILSFALIMMCGLLIGLYYIRDTIRYIYTIARETSHRRY